MNYGKLCIYIGDIRAVWFRNTLDHEWKSKWEIRRDNKILAVKSKSLEVTRWTRQFRQIIADLEHSHLTWEFRTTTYIERNGVQGKALKGIS